MRPAVVFVLFSLGMSNLWLMTGMLLKGAKNATTAVTIGAVWTALAGVVLAYQALEVLS